MKLKEIIEHLNAAVPPSLQEEYDNSGLITGNLNQEISSALLCIDSTEEVIDEAIQNHHQLIIAHHPIVFTGLKKFSGNSYIEKVIINAIKNDIAIFALHTNLDNVLTGVNQVIAQKLGLINIHILRPVKQQLRKLVTYCPVSISAEIRKALFEAGAGKIGNYDECSFNADGTGTFRGGENTNAFIGEKGKQHHEPETRIELIFPFYLQSKIITALKKAHPYEEVAYQITKIENEWQETGSGMIGEMKEGMTPTNFLQHLKHSMNTNCIRHTNFNKPKIKKVAICGGSGSFLLNDALAAGADVFVSADFKYHQFFDAGSNLMICDIGHFESEQFSLELFRHLLHEKFPKFATAFTKINTNPINYF